MLMIFTGYQIWQLHRRPLELLPAPINQRTGHPQEPNGQVVLAYGPRPEQIVKAESQSGSPG